MGILLLWGCAREPGGEPARTPSCRLTLDPPQGFYDRAVVVRFATEPAGEIRYAIATSATSAAPVSFPARPLPTDPPPISIPYRGPVALGDGYHLLKVRCPADGAWYLYHYLVDTVAPRVALLPANGTFRAPVTVRITSDDPGAEILARLYPEGATPPPFASLTTPAVPITTSGTWVLEAQAVDRVGNHGETVTGTYALRLSEAVLTLFGVREPAGRIPPLPRLEAAFDEAMDTSIVRLTGAVRDPVGSRPPIDLLLLWRDDRSFDAYPAERLPAGAAAEVQLAGLRSLAGGGVITDVVPDRLTFTVCADCAADPDPQISLGLPYGATVTAGAREITFTATVAPPDLDLTMSRLWFLYDDGSYTLLDTTDTSWSLQDLGGGRWLVTASTRHLPTGRISSAQLARIPSPESNRVFVARLATDTTTRPLVWVGSLPASGTTSPRRSLEFVAGPALDPASVTANVRVYVDGVTTAAQIFPLLFPGLDVWRVQPQPPPAPGSTVRVVVAGVRDLRGRTLPTTEASYVVSVVPPTTPVVEWNVRPGARVVPIGLPLVAVVQPRVGAVDAWGVYDRATGFRLDLFRLTLVSTGGADARPWSGSVLAVEAEPWVVALPPRDLELRLTLRFLDGTIQSRTLPFRSETPSEAVVFSGAPDGIAWLVTRPDGVAIAQIDYAWRVLPSIDQLSGSFTPAGGLGPIEIRHDGTGLYHYYPVGSTTPRNPNEALFPKSVAEWPAGAIAGPITLTISGGDVALTRRLYALPPEAVPYPVSPTEGTSVSATTEAVRFTWTVTASSGYDAIGVAIGTTSPTTQVTGLHLVPPGIDQVEVPRYRLPFPASGTSTILWAPVTIVGRGDPFDVTGLGPQLLGVGVGPWRRLELRGP